MAINLADGQLAAASATILGPVTAERTFMVTLYNTNATAQEVFLTLTRLGSTARTIFHATLETEETYYISGIAMDPSDVLAGYAGAAASVDYLISGTVAGPFAIYARDAKGTVKASQSLSVTLPDDSGLTSGEVEIVGLLEDIRNSLWEIKR